ncbi:MAG: hypothetical protein KDI71_05740 [Xanthomonadales bacterium]|nr:hypothetical protein [Xanthomonadales bacterium]
MAAEPASAAPRRSNAAAAALIGIVIGAMMGVLVATPLANSARLRHAYPRAIMNLLERDFDTVSEISAQQPCRSARLEQRLRRMRSLVVDTPAAFAAEDDSRFLAANQALIKALDEASGETRCADLVEAVNRVDRACEGCHADYR